MISPRTWGLAVLLGVVFAVLYADVGVGLWQDWRTDDNYAHGVLVPVLVTWLVWRQRIALRSLAVAPSLVGAGIVCASLAVLLVGHAAVAVFLTRISMVGVLGGMVVYVAGWGQLRLLSFPLLLLLIAIPLPALVFNEISFPLQLVASRFGVAALDVLAIPAVREGNIIRLDRATLVVAEACSGVRSLIAIGTLVLVYGHVGRQSRWARGVIACSILPIVVVANGLRVAGAGVAANAYGAAAADGFLHAFSGGLFFVASVGLLLLVERSVAAFDRPARGGLRWARP